MHVIDVLHYIEPDDFNTNNYKSSNIQSKLIINSNLQTSQSFIYEILFLINNVFTELLWTSNQ